MIDSYKEFFIADDLLEKEKIEQQLENYYKELANNKLKKLFNSKKNFKIENFLRDKLYKLSENIKEKENFCSSYEILKDESFLNYLKSGKNIVFDNSDRDFLSLYLKDDNNQKKLNSIDDFVLVHKTSYSPVNDTIYTPSSTGAMRKEVIQLCGKKYELNYKCANNSIHFAVNGPVGDHLYGSWSNRELAVITPMINCKNNKMISVRTEDTFSEGDFKLGDNSFCLCPIDRRDEIVKKNQFLKVLCYDKDKISLNEAIEILLCYLGYKVECVSTHSWINDADVIQFEKILDKFKSELGAGAEGHIYTKQFLEVFFNENIYRLIELLKCIRDNRLDIQSGEEFVKITRKRRTLGDCDIFGQTMANIDDIKNYMYKLITTCAEEGFYLPYDNVVRSLEENILNHEWSFNDLDSIFDQVNFGVFLDLLFRLEIEFGYYEGVLKDSKGKK